MKRLYEWCIATGTGPERRVSLVGLTDAEPRALVQMLEALSAVPEDTPARGWVTAMLYLSGVDSYERYETRAEAERAQGGTLHLVTNGADVTGAVASDWFAAAAATTVPLPRAAVTEQVGGPESPPVTGAVEGHR